MTPAACLLIKAIQREAEAFNAIATSDDDQSSFTRHGARARRDALDWALAQLTRAIPDIEDEAVAQASRTDAWLDAGAGIPTLSWDDEQGHRVEAPMT
jgi:hypothetical protein